MSETALTNSNIENQFKIDELTSFIFSPVNIFLNFSSGKSTLVIKAGNYVEIDKIKKYGKESNRLHTEQIANFETIDKLSRLLNQFKNKKLESEKVTTRSEFLIGVKSILVSGQFSTLDLTLAFFNTFNRLSKNDIEEINGKSIIFLRRSLITSAVFTFASILQGVNEIQMLSDLYHLAFLQDVSLVFNKSTYNIEKNFDLLAEDINIENTLLDEERNIFENSSTESKNLINEKYSSVFYSVEISELVERHLESPANNKGPRGLSIGELSDLESLLVELNNLIGLKNIEFAKNDFMFLVNKCKARYEISRSRGFRLFYDELSKLCVEETKTA